MPISNLLTQAGVDDGRQRVLHAMMQFFQQKLLNPLGGFMLGGVDAGLRGKMCGIADVVHSAIEPFESRGGQRFIVQDISVDVGFARD